MMESFDLIIVGSGAAGAMAALRGADLGLSVLIVEKAHQCGGTSATSGGVMWVPADKKSRARNADIYGIADDTATDTAATSWGAVFTVR